jgi:cytochrome c oxidase subunit 4
MGHHNSTEDLRSLYEGDQSKLYSGALAHHHDINSSESKAQVKRIWMITLYLSIITFVEVMIGLYGKGWGLGHYLMITTFLLLTVLKAYLIVKVFMHLGDEFKNFITMILLPLIFFVWFIIAFLADGSFWLWINQASGVK